MSGAAADLAGSPFTGLSAFPLTPLRDAVAVTDAASLPGGEAVLPCGDTSLALVLEA